MVGVSEACVACLLPGRFHERPKAPLSSRRCACKEHEANQIFRLEEVKERIITGYIREAVAMNNAGTKRPTHTVAIPADVRTMLRHNKLLKNFFDSFSYTHRNEYIRWIGGTGTKETRALRSKRMI